MLFAVAGSAWLIEMGLGATLWLQLRHLRFPPSEHAGVWVILLGLAALSQTVGVWLWRRRFLRPDRVARRLDDVWRLAGHALPVPIEVSTVAACRTVFVADAVTWMLQQAIAIYGLVAMIVVARVAPIWLFGGAALLALLAAAPRRQRMLALAEGLAHLAASVDVPAADPPTIPDREELRGRAEVSSDEQA